ncbi:WD repeat-containing protein 43-like protein [Dinothrombium tinctorium]|uniref:WD repeat-containing protein 43-like protein n=1 Tax=Dinothrombium tinctorium TaxID=1965070 RepID=A0A3S3Q2H9_9ACAR|nr:WD repeat-containing protein 43-like protein [Dinothrombium tinctorium]
MDSNYSKSAFSENHEYFGYSTSDGVLYFWDTVSSQLKSEYKPSSHLSATCTCICWGPSKSRAISSPRKKKRKSTADASEDISNLELVAIGTENGIILIYSIIKENLFAKLENGHSANVNGICWLCEKDSLFSCSSDLHVIEWSISTLKIKSKWKADDNELHAICCIDDSRLLTASSVIKLWNLKDQTLLQKFTGHATEVWKLLAINSQDLELQKNGYFLSAALGDRVISAWQAKSEGERKALASYVLTDEPVNVDVSKPASKEEPVMISAVTKSGDLLIFEHLLNGRRNTPFKPKVTVKIATDSSNTKYLPILAVKNCNDENNNLFIVYGSLLRPRFEKICVNECKKKTILVRDNHLAEAKSFITIEQKSLKVTEPKTSSDVKIMGPAQMNPVKPMLSPTKLTKSTKNTNHLNENNELSLSLDERLKTVEPTDQLTEYLSSEPPRADNFVHLLMQGLQSKDRRMLSTVLQRGDINLIKNTIKRLPMEYLSSLLEELQRHLYYKGDINFVYLKWLEALLQTKLSLILTLPNIHQQLVPILELLNIRCDIFDRMYKLRGRLNLMLSQIGEETDNNDVSKEPLLKYEESSSDEEEEENMDSDNEIQDLIDMGEREANDKEDVDEEMEEDDNSDNSESKSENSDYEDCS